MDQIPEIRLLSAQGKATPYMQLKQKPYNTAAKDIKINDNQIQLLKNSNHRIKLKDYLRLTTITKRSNSNSVKKDKSKNAIKTNVNLQTPSKNESLLDTQKSLSVLRQQLKSDITICSQKMMEVLQKVEKSGSRFENAEEEYDELVFMCQLHRLIKENIMSSLDKANISINDHKQKQFMKFSAKAKDLIGEDIKRTTTPKKRSGLYASCLRADLKNTHV